MTGLWGAGGPYQEWADHLRRWSAGEPVDLTALPTVELGDLTEDHWVRLTNQLHDAVARRLAEWAQVLARAMNNASDDFSVSRALVDARAGMQPIRSLAAHPGLPAGLTGPLLTTVDSQVRSVQETFEQQVESLRQRGVDRSAVEARLRVIRDNPLTAALTDVHAAPINSTGVRAADPTIATRRRVIVDRTRKEIR